MRYRVEILYKDNTFDMISTNIYKDIVELVKILKNGCPKFKDIRVYKLVGQYKNEDMEIQHNN